MAIGISGEQEEAVRKAANKRKVEPKEMLAYLIKLGLARIAAVDRFAAKHAGERETAAPKSKKAAPVAEKAKGKKAA